MLTNEQFRYLLVAIVAIALAWRFQYLPASLAQLLDKYVPHTVAHVVKGEEEPSKLDQKTAGCPPKSSCEDFVTNTQCGICPSACEWLNEKCTARARSLTPDEKQSV